MNSKQEAVAYLQEIRQHYTDYHEHKEKSAWAAVVLYVLFAGTLLPIQLRGPDTVWYDTGYTAFIVVVAALVFFYARNQLDLKNEGRVYVAASMQLLLELMAMDEESSTPRISPDTRRYGKLELRFGSDSASRIIRASR